MASRAHPSASSAVSPKMTSLGSSAIVSTTPDDPIGSMLITYLFAMVRLPPFVVDSALKLNKRPESTRHELGKSSTERGSSERATLQTAPVWLCIVVRGCPLPASHSFTAPSTPPLAGSPPSLLSGQRGLA